jgi:DNA (cytosine-5)-methyltransferase 1
VRLTHFSLFTGIGGIDLAAEWAGFETAGQCEIDDYRCRVLEKYWPNVPRWRDVRDVTKQSVEKAGVGAITLISGGFPCQPYSLAGKRRGEADDRHLWPEMFRVIKELRPRWVLAENVNGLVSMGVQDGPVRVESRNIVRRPDYDLYEAVLSRQEIMLLNRICGELEAEGYEVQPLVVPACAVGAPHRRDRIWIVAYSPGVERRPGAEEQRVLRGMPANGKERSYAGGSGEAQSEKDVADAPIKQAEPTKQPRQRNGIKQGSQDVAHSEGDLRGTPRDKRLETPNGGSPNVADAKDEGLPERRHRPGENKQQAGEEETNCTIARLAGCSLLSGGDAYNGNSQSRVGRDFTRFPSRLDGHRWPAPYGCEQYEWEPPRVARDVPNRRERLEALGDAVVPQQVYPILVAIVAVEREFYQRRR